MHTKQSMTRDLTEILVKPRISVFDLPLRERLVLIRHLIQKGGG